MKFVNIVRFSKKKKQKKTKKNAMHKYIDLTVEAYEEYFKISFSGEGVLLNSIMDIHGSTEERGTDKNPMAVDVRGGAVKIFHFAELQRS